ncbi:YfiT family bacillithiol transferase [Cyclobacterium xiamenense]|uniref:YfiT family bacillithiol transferase n=1 Tax=Cyclobacterium xiamenense TaxID=1297121 RepID=UPI0012BA02FB|nr:putative metal-dependent hydrolase [Cyclobacterium xiamenense]
MQNERLMYPIGRFQQPKSISLEALSSAILGIQRFPEAVADLLTDLPEERLDSRYRPGGWTIRQLVHHLADSHMNAYMRFKLALTEETPVIKPYKENHWAALADSKLGIDVSVQLLAGIHERWCFLMQNMDESQWIRRFFHPEQKQSIALNVSALAYDWHGRHHLAHIRLAK